MQIDNQSINELLDRRLLQWHEMQEKRTYLGASMIGDECIRKVQLQYLGHEPTITAKQVRTFDIGHRLEDLVIHWLRIAGFYVVTKDEDGKQFGFSTADGKIAGHVDGIIQAFPKELLDPTSRWPAGRATNGCSVTLPRRATNGCSNSLLEVKTMSNKSWNDTVKRGVLVSKPIYYVQVQLYMAYMPGEMQQCLFVALNKDTSELYFEMIAFDAETAQKYSDRAAQIIKASENNELLPCISNDPSFYLCKMCGFRGQCRGSN